MSAHGNKMKRNQPPVLTRESECIYRGKKLGFTLLELLGVIAIIAILAAILLSAVGFVREKAQAAKCLANIKQILAAAQIYVADNGQWPPAWIETSPGSRVPAANWYDGAILGGYLNVPIAKLRCPSTPPNKGGTIGYNWPLGPGVVGFEENGWPQVRPGMISRPSAVPAFMDIGGASLFNTASWSSGQTNSTGMAPRHSGCGNVGYCDGHVAALKYDEWKTHEGYPEKWLCPWTIP